LGRARNTEDDVRIIAEPWKGRRGLHEKLAANFPTLELKVVRTSELRLESSPHVGSSPVGL
jgi:hypothetical protein